MTTTDIEDYPLINLNQQSEDTSKYILKSFKDEGILKIISYYQM